MLTKNLSVFASLTIVYFAIGFLSSFNDTLTPFFKNYLNLDYFQAALVSFSFFIAYLLASLPIAKMALSLGFRRSIVAGVLLSAFGALLFTLAAKNAYFVEFLIALFITAMGVVMMLLVVMPYVSLLGSRKTASSRMSFMQGFHSIGAVVAPLVGSIVLLSNMQPSNTGKLPLHPMLTDRINETYIIIALVLMVFATLISLSPMPKVASPDISQKSGSPILKHLLGYSFIALFVYVGAEVTTANFMINDFTAQTHGAVVSSDAAKYVSMYWLGMLFGRFIGSYALKMLKPPVVLTVCTIMAGACVLIGTFLPFNIASIALVLVGLFNGIMFPTIYSFGLASLSHKRLMNSGILGISITGGAIIPLVQGYMADIIGIQASYIVPFCCYIVILIYCLYMIKAYSQIMKNINLGALH